jgi:hypothetical protein
MRKNSVEAGCSFTVFAVLDSAKQRKRLLERTGSACRFDEGSAYLTDTIMADVGIPCDLVKNMNSASPLGAHAPNDFDNL